MPNTLLKDAKILIVDDELANVRLLEVILEEAGYTTVESTTDPRTVLPLFEAHQHDLILLDLMMPHLDGFAVMAQLEAHIEEGIYLPILVLTADITPQVKRKALGQGAKDFLTKPLDTTEVLLRINNLLEARFRHLLLEKRVRERTEGLKEAQLETLRRLALAAEYRDDDTGQHTTRVGLVSSRLAQCLGLPADQVDLIQCAAPLHDVGKIGISDTILLKPGKLTDEEFAIMRTHAAIGAKILSGSGSPWLQLAEEIALTHHERWDGNGYPNRLQGEAIPLTGRMLTVADVFDALTHERPYKKAWPVQEAVAEIEKQAGRQFDSQVVAAFMQLPHDELL